MDHHPRTFQFPWNSPPVFLTAQAKLSNYGPSPDNAEFIWRPSVVLGPHSSCHSERKAQGFVIFSGRSTLALRFQDLQHAASCSFLDTSPVQVSAGVKAILRSQLFHVMITLLYHFPISYLSRPRDYLCFGVCSRSHSPSFQDDICTWWNECWIHNLGKRMDF